MITDLKLLMDICLSIYMKFKECGTCTNHTLSKHCRHTVGQEILTLAINVLAYTDVWSQLLHVIGWWLVHYYTLHTYYLLPVQVSQTPLFAASWKGYIIAVAELLLHNKADITICDKVYDSVHYGMLIINPRRACAARVTVLGLSVCVCVCVCLSDALFLGHGKLTRRKEGTSGFGATLRRLL